MINTNDPLRLDDEAGVARCRPDRRSGGFGAQSVQSPDRRSGLHFDRSSLEAKGYGCVLLLLFALVSLLTAPQAVGEVIAEGFDHNREAGIVLCDAAGERIFRSMSSKFAWGAYSVSGRRIMAGMHNKAPVLRFEEGAFAPGSYVYTRLDARTVQASGGMANHPSRAIDLSGPGAQITLGIMRSKTAVAVSFLVRDGKSWWRSGDCELPTYLADYNNEKRAEFDLHALRWIKLKNTAEMDEVDDGDATPVEDGAAGVPDFAHIEGLGLMARRAAAHVVDFAGMALKDGAPSTIDLSQPLKHSDIAFLHKPTPLEKFEEYGGAKIVYWDQGWVPEQVALTLDYGVRDMPGVSGGVIENHIAQENPTLKAAIGRDLWGKEVLVGNESFPTGMQARMCMRQPAFLQYSKDYVRLHVHGCGASEALFDEPNGFNGSRTAFLYSAGCFCDVCNDGFREWLVQRFNAAELATLGISDVAHFDYRALLRSKAKDLPAYRAAFEHGELPLIKLFIRFQQEPQRKFFTTLRDYAKTLNPNFRFSANTFGLKSELLYLAEEVETDFHGAESEIYLHDFRQFGKALLRFRLADALDIRMVTSGVFWEFRHARTQNLVEIFKVIMPAVYASGHHLAVPDLYRWTDPNYVGSIPDLAPFYRFVRRNPALFDDYAPVTQVGIVMDNSVANEYTGDATFRQDYDRVGQGLIERGILTGVIMGADGFHYRKEFTREDVDKRFQWVVLPRNTRLAGAQAQIIADLKKEGRVIQCDERGLEGVLPSIRPWVSCDQQKILVQPRTKPGDAKAPVVVHLVNLDYRPDAVQPKANVTLTIDRALLGQPVQRVTCHSPLDVSVSLPFTQDETGLRVTVPELNYWSILEIERSP